VCLLFGQSVCLLQSCFSQVNFFFKNDTPTGILCRNETYLYLTKTRSNFKAAESMDASTWMVDPNPISFVQFTAL
jgi:hypothetical protein